MQIIKVDEFPLERFQQLQLETGVKKNLGTRQGRKYLDCVTAFDIETTGLDELRQSFMYVWQWQFEDWFTVVGRTWDELRQLIHRLLPAIAPEESLVVLVHNLSYEFQFLRQIYRFEPDEVFAVKPRRVLKCTMHQRRLEFRCTYLHSNMGLAAYLKKMRVPVQKLTMDYSVRRYPWTPLTGEELSYCQADVLGLVQAYREEMRREGDNIASTPLTSTGYVRRDTKRVMRGAGREAVRKILPDYRQYQLLRDAFRGGDTHANRYYVGCILENVKSADRSSSYPDVICNRQFPMTPFIWLTSPSVSNVNRAIRRGRAVAFRITLHNVRLRDPYDGFPYIPVSRCQQLRRPVKDNGRVLAASMLEIAVTDVDWKIIRKQYRYDHAEISEAMTSRYDWLPMPLRVLVVQYYQKKTQLKGIDDPDIQYLYQKIKELLNSCYGMMAQDPVKDVLQFLEDEELFPFQPEGKDREQLLNEYQRRAFLPYQWGVWVTAWAREALRSGLEIAGHDAVYCDTDSVKYLNDHDFSDFNEQCIKDDAASEAWADDPAGHRHYMGVFEPEATSYRFITQGAKKYASANEAGHIKLTLAGVNKKLGASELEAAGGLEAFREGMIFIEAGGLESVYNDHPDIDLEIDGHKLHIGPNIYLGPSTYTLGQEADYKKLLLDPSAMDMIEKSLKNE